MQTSDGKASDKRKGNAARGGLHPRHQNAVLGMDVPGGEGDLFGEERESEAGDQEEEVPDIPEDEADQGEENPEGADEAGKVEEIFEGEAEDMAPKRISPDPGLPTEAEIDDHEVDHVPFRRWCEECVEGRGTGEQHRSREGPHAVPTIAFDYLFVTPKKILSREELEAEDEEAKKACVKILVVKDLRNKPIFAHVVPQKGVDADGYSVVRLVDDIKWLGYTKVLLKADNERPIVRLLIDALRRLRIEGLEQVAQEAPVPYDSSSNGSVENAVKQVQGLLRTVKLGFEKHVGTVVPDRHPIFSWMVEHVGWILTTRTRGSDGRTGFQRVRGKPFTKRLVQIMEQCLYKLPVKGPQREAAGKLGARWRRGIFLGFNRASSEYLFWDGNQVARSRAVQRLKKGLRWPKDAYEKVSKDPHSIYSALDPEKWSPNPNMQSG